MTAAEEIAEALAEARDELGVSVVYCVGDDELAIEKTTKGKWTFKFVNHKGITERIETTDFLIGSDDLVIEPVAGHRIRELIGDKVFNYDVTSVNNEPCWRWSEATGHSQRRIHTKLVKTVT